MKTARLTLAAFTIGKFNDRVRQQELGLVVTFGPGWVEITAPESVLRYVADTFSDRADVGDLGEFHTANERRSCRTAAARIRAVLSHPSR